MIRLRSLDLETQGSLLAIATDAVAAFAALKDYLEVIAENVAPELAESARELIDAIEDLTRDMTAAVVAAESERLDDSIVATGDVIELDGPRRVLAVTDHWVVLDAGADAPRIEARAGVEQRLAASSRSGAQ